MYVYTLDLITRAALLNDSTVPTVIQAYYNIITILKDV